MGEYAIDKESFKIGRNTDNDIQINSWLVSQHHAQISVQTGNTYLSNLDRSVGTYVNHKLISRHPLQHGDLISIGGHQLKYLEEPT